MSIKLFYHPESCALAPHILLIASGLPFTLVKVGFGDQFPAEYAKLNPKKQVPFIELEHGTILTEVPAIVTAIDRLKPDQEILGSSHLGSLRSYEWMNYLSSQVHAQGFSLLFRPERFVEDEGVYESVRRMARKRINAAFAYLESKVDQMDSIEDGKLLAHDAHLFVYFRWANSRSKEFDIQSDFPKVYARMVAFSKLASVNTAVQEQGIRLLG